MGLDDACDMEKKISSVERNIAVPASRRQESDSVLRAEVENGIENNDFEPDQDTKEDSSRLESDTVSKIEVENVCKDNNFDRPRYEREIEISCSFLC